MRASRFSIIALVVASVFSQANFADEVDTRLLELQQLQETQHFTEIVAKTAQVPEEQLPLAELLVKLDALANLPEQAERADELATAALKRFNNEPELLLLAAQIKFNLAQQASIFSAPGLAKDGLSLLQQAQQAAPQNDDVNQTLIGFYLGAPSIVGGDEDKAKALAEQWVQRDALAGNLMMLNVLKAQDKAEAAEKLLAQLEQTAPDNHRVLAARGRLLLEQEQFADAVAAFHNAAAHADKASYKMFYFYEIGRITAVNKLAAEPGVSSLQQYIAYYQASDNPRLPWAQARLARIQMQSADQANAKATLTPLLAQKWPDDKLNDELKKLKKQLKI